MQLLQALRRGQQMKSAANPPHNTQAPSVALALALAALLATGWVPRQLTERFCMFNRGLSSSSPVTQVTITYKRAGLYIDADVYTVKHLWLSSFT